MKTKFLIIIGVVVIGIILALTIGKQVYESNDDPAFLSEYPRISQNDMYCRTQWYLKNTTLDEGKLILALKNTISGFGSHVDIPEREISIFHNEEETVISIAGIWTEDQNQHQALTSVVKNYIDEPKFIRDDVILCV